MMLKTRIVRDRCAQKAKMNLRRSRGLVFTNVKLLLVSLKANLVMFMRKEGESISDEDDEEGGGTAPAAQAPSDDMMTTRPAGNFTGQVASNENLGGPTSPTSDMKTTRPAGNFTGQVASNATPGAPIDPKSSELRTTRPAGAFNGQVTPNAASAADEKDDFKTTKDAGPFENLQKNNKK